MWKKTILALSGVLLVVAAIVYIKLGQFSTMEQAAITMTMPPETVTASVVEQDNWEQVIPATATVSAVQGVTISAEVSGRITRIDFDSADAVEQGDILLQMDTSTELSQLASAQASAELAKSDLARLRKLVKQKLASADALDRAEAEVKETVAQVGVIQALINKKTLRAPFSGRLGIRQVDLGEVLSVDDPVVSLQMLDPVYLDFSIPQQQLTRLTTGMQLRATADALVDTVFKGQVTAINPQIDQVTRNVKVRALVDNPDELLRSGMFVNVELLLADSRQVLSVPATAVLFATFGNSVFVVDSQTNSETGETNLVLRQQFISLGESRGDFVEVKAGLKAGETVVTSGVFKLRAGSPVIIDNKLSPQFSLTPAPADS